MSIRSRLKAIRFSEKELVAIEGMAKEMGISFSEFVRQVLMSRVRRGLKDRVK